MNAAIATRTLAKTFSPHSKEPVHAVRGLDLTIESGEIVAILGPNGAGKTTAIDMILGLTSPSSGTAEVFGMNPRAAVRDARVAAVLQTGGLLRDITVRETVEVIGAQFDAPASVDSVLERAGITKLAKRRVSKCSGGEQQRLKFALALVADPDLLILDEPTAGMDVNARHSFWEAMHAEAHRTVLFATHYLEEAQAFADRIILMSGGEVIADGPTEEIRALTTIRTITFHTSDPTIAGRLGAMPSVSSVSNGTGRVTVETSDSDALLRPILEWGGREIEVAAPSLESAFMALTEEV